MANWFGFRAASVLTCENSRCGYSTVWRWRAVLLAIACALIAATARAQGSGPSPVAGDEEPAIIVTGSRVPRPNDTSVSPAQTVRREDFLLTGVPSVEQTLNQLPQLLPTFTNTSNSPGSGAATLDLRGLGSVRTLILVNGRRWIASDAGEIPEVDVNTIPSALIDRVDLVTGGASAVYGSDAVTGVVNFVLDDGFEGLQVEARQNITELGDGRVTSADLTAGMSFAGDRGHAVVSAGWLDQAPVLQGNRRLSRFALNDGCAIPGTRNPFGASTAVDDPDCAPPNELALVAGGSGIIPGTRITGTAFFPVAGGEMLIRNQAGLRFAPDGAPRPFLFPADAYNFAPDNYLQIGFRRWSANLLASFEASAALIPYAELSWIETRSPQQLAPVPAVLGGGVGSVPEVLLNLDNPFLTAEAAQGLDLSFGVDSEGDRGFTGSPATGFRLNPAYDGDADGIVSFVRLGSRLDLGPRRRRNRREALRGLVGVRGEIADSWGYDVYFSHSRVEHVTDYENSGSALRLQQAILVRRDPITGMAVCIDPSDGCAPANIFGIGNLSAAAAEFIATDPADLTIVEQQAAEAVVRGEVALLPAGPAGIAVGVGWRRNAYDFQPDPGLLTGDDLGFEPGVPAAGDTRVYELFAETRLPLLAGLPFAEDVTAELGMRWSDYDTVGGVWTWKALAEWTPITGLRVRGGWQRAVRAPNVRELFEAPLEAFGDLEDPCSGTTGLLGNAQIRAACLLDGVPAELLGGFLSGFSIISSRGDPGLEAEIARTITIGAVLEPRSVPGLNIAVDYYDIRIRRSIGTFGGGATFTIFGCITGGADPADPLCQAYDRGADGTVTVVEQPTANLELLSARGIDWQIAYGRRFGPHRIDLSLTGTRYFESGFRANANVPFLDCAGLFGAPCGNTIVGAAMPEWKLFNRVTWSLGSMSLMLRHRWFSATSDARIALNEALGLPPPDLPEEGRRLESRHYFDLAAMFEIGGGFELTLGVNNLSNRRPAITGNNQVQSNTDPSLYDVLGRRFFAVLSVRRP